MTVFKIETYVVKPEKQQEFKETVEKWLSLKEKNRRIFRKLKSWKMLTQMIGGIYGSYMEISEFQNMASLERFANRMAHDKTAISDVVSNFMNCLQPATYMITLWEPFR